MRYLLLAFVWVPESFEQLGDVMSKHIVHSLHHFRFQLLKLIDAVAAQNFFKVLDVREIPGWEMILPLNLIQAADRI